MITASILLYDETIPLLDPTSGMETARQLWLHDALDSCLNLLPAHVTRTPRRLLDLGCGPGFWVQAVAATCRHAEIVGVDPNPQNVAYANARLQRYGHRHARCHARDLRQPL